MPIKDDIQLTPHNIGLTQKDIMYLLTYKELEMGPQHAGGIYNKMKEDLDHNLLKSRAHYYKSVEEMNQQGWIAYIKKGKKKIYSMTPKGKEELNRYRETYLEPFKQVRHLAGFLMSRIAGSYKESVPDISRDKQKLFNRLINVKELTIYLFLKILQDNPDPNPQMTAKEIYEVMGSTYGWTCSIGYLYETAHAIEEGGWIDGAWSGKRRTDYRYLLTVSGEEYLPKAAEDAMYHVRKCYKFMESVIFLLEPSSDLSDSHVSWQNLNV